MKQTNKQLTDSWR